MGRGETGERGQEKLESKCSGLGFPQRPRKCCVPCCGKDVPTLNQRHRLVASATGTHHHCWGPPLRS